MTTSVRVRPISPKSRHRAAQARSRRDALERPAVVTREEPAEEPVTPEERERRAEQRIREAGGPIDQACFQCSCGYVFETAVSTTVTCPNCGAGQAW